MEGDKQWAAKEKSQIISIHALRVEGDAVMMMDDEIREISIHALRVEGDFPLLAFPLSQ